MLCSPVAWHAVLLSVIALNPGISFSGSSTLLAQCSLAAVLIAFCVIPTRQMPACHYGVACTDDEERFGAYGVTWYTCALSFPI